MHKRALNLITVILVIICTIIAFLSVPGVFEASWVYLTPEKLIEMSDAIVIGEVTNGLNSNTSLHFDLDQWGQTVMLFLKKGKNYYEPHSPQAVVAVSIISSSTSSNPLDIIKINDPRLPNDEKVKFESFIKNSEIIQEGDLSDKSNASNSSHKSTKAIGYYFITAVLFLCTALSIIILIKRKALFRNN